MRTYYDWIYLSPHLDDAALSCGGQIFQHTRQGAAVLIVTIMAGDPPTVNMSGYAQSLHDRWQMASDAVAGRRAEDLAACRILGADALHWREPDCIYRTHPRTNEPFYTSDEDIFGIVDLAEMALVETLAQQIQGLPAHDRLVAPLALGHHVDHQLTRLASERSAAGRPLSYYEDYPYAQDCGAQSEMMGAEAEVWQSVVLPLADDEIAAKLEAIAAFQSQLSTFFRGRMDMEHQVTDFVRATGGERIWHQRCR